MKTIEIYEKTKTSELQSLLKQYETYIENGNLILERHSAEISAESMKVLKDTMNDYQIDVALLRMELNKRLWFN